MSHIVTINSGINPFSGILLNARTELMTRKLFIKNKMGECSITTTRSATLLIRDSVHGKYFRIVQQTRVSG